MWWKEWERRNLNLRYFLFPQWCCWTFWSPMMWRFVVVCSAIIFSGQSAFIPHFDYNTLNRIGNKPWSLKHLPLFTHRDNFLSQHTWVVNIKVILYGILSCYQPSLITTEHFPYAADTRFTGCMSLWVCLIWICTKWTISVCVKVISEQPKFTHTQEHLV
jgi:hypothetical protein